jgi:hypothetical protein
MAFMARESWTDERLDDLKGRMDEGFREVKGEIAEVRSELRTTRTELKEEIAKLDTKFDRLTFTLIAALISLIATHYLG